MLEHYLALRKRHWFQLLHNSGSELGDAMLEEVNLEDGRMSLLQCLLTEFYRDSLQ